MQCGLHSAAAPILIVGGRATDYRDGGNPLHIGRIVAELRGVHAPGGGRGGVPRPGGCRPAPCRTTSNGGNVPKATSGEVTIHYQSHGEGPPLLLIMGFGQSGDMWIPVLPYLDGFRVLFFDNRGTGRSGRPAAGYTIPDMAGDARAVLDAEGIERAHVYGVSMGGMIAQELTLESPDRVDRLVLGCTTAGLGAATFPEPDVVLALVRAAELMSTEPARSVELLLPLLFPPEFIEASPTVNPVKVKLTRCSKWRSLRTQRLPRRRPR